MGESYLGWLNAELLRLNYYDGFLDLVLEMVHKLPEAVFDSVQTDRRGSNKNSYAKPQ